MQPILAYVRKVTKMTGVTRDDVRAVLDAGWTEADLHDAVLVTSLFNFMNRLVEGSGLASKESYIDPSPDELNRRRQGTYLGWGRSAGFID